MWMFGTVAECQGSVRVVSGLCQAVLRGERGRHPQLCQKEAELFPPSLPPTLTFISFVTF